MKLESKDLNMLLDLVNQYEGLSKDTTIRLTYTAITNMIEIEILRRNNFDILKRIEYQIKTKEDIDELANILGIYIAKIKTKEESYEIK